MKKVVVLIIAIMLFMYGCKKSDTQTQADNKSDETVQVEEAVVEEIVVEVNETKIDMTPFTKALSVFQNPQYDFIYKFLEKGIDAELEEDVTIAYPKHAKRLLIDEEEITIKKGATPLGIAALFCTPSLVNELIKQGADLKAKVNGNGIAATIIQCGKAEQAGMFENYLKAIRKYEQDHPETYKNKPELYAANSMIHITNEDGDYIPWQTILNYATENKINDAIPIILKYAGGINYFKNDNNNPNNILPIITSLNSKNYEATRLFFAKTGSLFTQLTTLDGVKTSLLDYLFYNAMDKDIQAADIPMQDFFKSLISIYKPDANGIAEIKLLLETGDEYASINNHVEYGDIGLPATSNMAHIAAALKYNALLKGIVLYTTEDVADTLHNVVNRMNEYNETPLDIAVVQVGNLETAKILLEGGAFTDIYLTPFGHATLDYDKKNKADMTKLLLTTVQYSDSNTYRNADMDINAKLDEDPKKYASTRGIFKKYYVNNGYRADLLRVAKANAIKELNPAIVRLMQGGIDNQLPFAVKFNDEITFPKGSTPLIAASIACAEDTAIALINAKASLDIRISGQNDLKYDAYDFADRVATGNCENIKKALKDPNSIHIDFEKVLAISERGYTQEQHQKQNDTKDEEAYSEEGNKNNASNLNTTKQADVNLISDD